MSGTEKRLEVHIVDRDLRDSYSWWIKGKGVEKEKPNWAKKEKISSFLRGMSGMSGQRSNIPEKFWED